MSCQRPSKLPLLLPIVNFPRQIAQSASRCHEGLQFGGMCSVWIFMVIAWQVITFIDVFWQYSRSRALVILFPFCKVASGFAFFFLPKSYKVALKLSFPSSTQIFCPLLAGLWITDNPSTLLWSFMYISLHFNPLHLTSVLLVKTLCTFKGIVLTWLHLWN